MPLCEVRAGLVRHAEVGFVNCCGCAQEGSASFFGLHQWKIRRIRSISATRGSFGDVVAGRRCHLSTAELCCQVWLVTLKLMTGQPCGTVKH